MNTRLALPIVLFAGFLVLASVNVADAQWDALGSGFAVTTDWHGEYVQIGTSVTATAGWAPSLIPDNNPAKGIAVQTVEFVWHYPDGTVNVDFGETVPISADVPASLPPEVAEWIEDHPSVEVWFAQSTPRTPLEVGDWGVQAIFHDTVKINGKNSDTVMIRATSFFALPEIPLGTIAILASTFGVLGVFALRKRRLHR